MAAKRVYAISRALADPRRYEIFRHVATEECSPCSALRECFPIAPATLSHHLKELEAAGLVQTTKRGKFVDVRFCRATWEHYLASLALVGRL